MFYTNKHCYYDTSVNYRFTRIRWYTARVVVDCEFFRHYIEGRKVISAILVCFHTVFIHWYEIDSTLVL